MLPAAAAPAGLAMAASLSLQTQFLSREAEPPIAARPAVAVAAQAGLPTAPQARDYCRRKDSATSAGLIQVSDSSGPLNQWPRGHRIFMLTKGPSVDRTAY